MAPFKRARVPKMTTQALLGFDLDEESSDSDFMPEPNGSDDDCSGSDESKDDDSGQDDSEDDDDDDDDGEGGGDSDGSDDSTQQLKQLLSGAANTAAGGVSVGVAAGSVEAQINGSAGDDLERMLRQLDGKAEEEKTLVQQRLPTKAICCVCLGDRSDDSNELVECDGCGVSVHEGCYGVSDNASISSTNSTCSTEPWFCEACRAGVRDPICELCPNKGGIYKETDVGRWVHLVCALYVPGVAFGEVDQLSAVTLFEMQYSKWGAKVCSLCESARFARTGVCIGCDAGMCKTYFHVTCAQAAGFLTEAHHEEAEAADPFYAHCKVHSEKEMIKKRKRNFHTFRLNMQQKQTEKQAAQQLAEQPSAAQQRIQRKLLKYQRKYATHKQLKAEPWVPTQKMPRLLTTSASSCRRLLAKASIAAVDVELLEQQEAQIAALTDIRKKWHIAPAFSVEFIGYYLDRIARSKELKQQLTEMIASNGCLSREQATLRRDYDARLDRNKALKQRQETLSGSIATLHKQLSALCPSKQLPNAAHIGQRVQAPSPMLQQQHIPSAHSTPPPLHARPISVPTAAALKMGVGFPLAHLGPPGTKVDSTRLLSTHAKNSPTSSSSATGAAAASTLQHALTPGIDRSSVVVACSSSAPTTPTLGVQTFECGICKRCTDQHLLAKCDTCKLHYHLGCLNPPLTRHPKKSKLYGWQCSECDKSDESDAVTDLPKGPRKSRTRFNKDGCIVPVIASHLPTHTSVVPKDVSLEPPLKRRSVDAAPSSAAKASIVAAKKHLNKSLPAAIEAAAANPALKTTPFAIMAKKSKLSLSYSGAPQQEVLKEKPQLLTTPVKQMPDNIKSVKVVAPHQRVQQPIHATLPADEPLLLVLPNTSTPRAANPTETTDHDPLALPASSNVSMDESSDPSKQARKQKRKEKHRNKHNLSSDTEKSPNKEHKRKRKKKMHDFENPNDSSGGIPKIKIKFKTLPLPGEVTPEAQFFYVSADMVRSAEEASRPTSVETVEDLAPPQQVAEQNPTKCLSIPSVAISAPAAAPPVATPTAAAMPAAATATKTTPTATRKSSPRKTNPRHSTGARPKSLGASAQPLKSLDCSVCRQPGITSNVVTCDECRKNYHFTCLDPPLKKSPKIRGYSWHCADCDPTDEEIK